MENTGWLSISSLTLNRLTRIRTTKSRLTVTSSPTLPASISSSSGAATAPTAAMTSVTAVKAAPAVTYTDMFTLIKVTYFTMTSAVPVFSPTHRTVTLPQTAVPLTVNRATKKSAAAADILLSICSRQMPTVTARHILPALTLMRTASLSLVKFQKKIGNMTEPTTTSWLPAAPAAVVPDAVQAAASETSSQVQTPHLTAATAVTQTEHP